MYFYNIQLDVNDKMGGCKWINQPHPWPLTLGRQGKQLR